MNHVRRFHRTIFVKIDFRSTLKSHSLGAVTSWYGGTLSGESVVFVQNNWSSIYHYLDCSLIWIVFCKIKMTIIIFVIDRVLSQYFSLATFEIACKKVGSIQHNSIQLQTIILNNTFYHNPLSNPKRHHSDKILPVKNLP